MPYTHCCQPKHLGTHPATTAEELMRSRYSAFCCGDTEYLVTTLLPSMRNENDLSEIRQTMSTTQWTLLQVIQHQQKGDAGTVEFAAFFHAQGKMDQLHEKSNFVREGEHWYYIDGKQLPPIKLQRNDPCKCGSGKKLKKCCLTSQ